MGSANVELVRSIYADWERGDFSSAGWADPDIEYVVADGPDPQSRRGVDAMAEANRDFLSAWESFRVRAENLLEVDAERVLVFAYQSGRGKTSGVDIGHLQAERAHVWHVREGNVVRLAIYYDREHALGDVGLAPEAGSPHA